MQIKIRSLTVGVVGGASVAGAAGPGVGVDMAMILSLD